MGGARAVRATALPRFPTQRGGAAVSAGERSHPPGIPALGAAGGSDAVGRRRFSGRRATCRAAAVQRRRRGRLPRRGFSGSRCADGGHVAAQKKAGHLGSTGVPRRRWRRSALPGAHRYGQPPARALQRPAGAHLRARGALRRAPGRLRRPAARRRAPWLSADRLRCAGRRRAVELLPAGIVSGGLWQRLSQIARPLGGGLSRENAGQRAGAGPAGGRRGGACREKGMRKANDGMKGA